MPNKPNYISTKFSRLVGSIFVAIDYWTVPTIDISLLVRKEKETSIYENNSDGKYSNSRNDKEILPVYELFSRMTCSLDHLMQNLSHRKSKASYDPHLDNGNTSIRETLLCFEKNCLFVNHVGTKPLTEEHLHGPKTKTKIRVQISYL